jgi:hypothetical protein
MLNDVEQIKFQFEKEWEKKARSLFIPVELCVVEEQPKHSFGWVFGLALAEKLKEEGHKVYLKKQNGLAKLSYRVLRLSVEYRERGFFKKSVERRIEGEVVLDCVLSDGRFLWSNRIRFEKVDNMAKGEARKAIVEGLGKVIESSSPSLLPYVAAFTIGVFIIALYTVGY